MRPGTPSTADEHAASGPDTAGGTPAAWAAAGQAESARASLPARTATHCPYCSLQCGMEIVRQPGEPVEVVPSAVPTNRGTMCQKGWTAGALLGHPDRLTAPLLRDSREAELRLASWDEALDRVAAALSGCAAPWARRRRRLRGAAG